MSVLSWSWGLPALFLGGCWVLSRLLRLPMLLAAAIGALPALAAHLELPFTPGSADPLLIVVVGWALLLALGVGRFLALALLPVLTPSSSVTGLFLAIGSIACAGIAAALWVAPELVDRLVPLWQGALGTGLLLFALAGFTLSFARAVRSAIGVAFWFLICAAFASEVLLQRTPREVLSDQFRAWAFESAQVQRSTPEVAVQGARSTRGTVRVALVREEHRGDSMAGELLRQQLEGQLNAQHPESPFEVVGISFPGASIIQVRERLGRYLEQLTPDLVVFGSWFADAETGSNSVGLPGLTERQALQKAEQASALSELPIIGGLLRSYLSQAIRLVFQGAPEPGRARLAEIPARVPPSEYAAELRAIAAHVAASKSLLVLAPEPVPPFHERRGREYLELLNAREAMPGETTVVLTEESRHTFTRFPYDLLFVSNQVPTARGAELWAGAIRQTLQADTRVSSTVRALLQEGVERNRGIAQWLVAGQELPSELSVALVVPEAGGQFYKVALSADGLFIEDRRLNDTGLVTVRFRIPAAVRQKPIVHLALSVSHSPPAATMRIGDTDFFFPLPVRLVSEAAVGRALLAIGGDERPLSTATLMRVAAIDLRSGVVRKQWDFGEDLEEETLIRAIRAVAWGEAAAIVLRVPLVNTPSPALVAAFSYLGIHELPQPGESFVALGVGGMRKRSGLVARGLGAQQLALSSERTERYSQFQLKTSERLAGLSP